MNNTEINQINVEIAAIKGLKTKAVLDFNGDAVYLIYDECGNHVNYITDNNLNHGLVVELLDKGWYLVKVGNDYRWINRKMFFEVSEMAMDLFQNKDFKTATALAWIEEFSND